MIADLKDYYELLGISREASGEEIRKAFRKLARRFHPDLADYKARAEEKFKEINEAYEVLGDPENRRKYDLGQGRWHRFSGFGSRHMRRENDRFRRRNGREDFRPYTERPEFRSFYEDFFGGQRGGANSFSRSEADNRRKRSSTSDRSSRSPRPGNDIEGEMLVSLGEVLNGSIHTIAVLRNNPLTGEPEQRPLHVRIPAGVRDGQMLRLVGRGDYGIEGGPAGDLFLRIRYARHPEFRVSGTDLMYELELTPWEAFFGARKTISTLDGEVAIKVPSATSGGQRLRLRGRGLPDSEGIRGDLYALVSVKIRLRDLAKKVFRRG
ncbi:MAG: J domain-containing protein [Verrucomicrobia bacterium]|nr:J domain-containing protein [Verrucomicrobiota bacterium]